VERVPHHLQPGKKLSAQHGNSSEVSQTTSLFWEKTATMLNKTTGITARAEGGEIPRDRRGQYCSRCDGTCSKRRAARATNDGVRHLAPDPKRRCHHRLIGSNPPPKHRLTRLFFVSSQHFRRRPNLLLRNIHSHIPTLDHPARDLSALLGCIPATAVLQ
jgi:hypothetical protein